MEGLCKIHYFSGILKRLNPFRWSIRTIKVTTAAILLIFLPIYIFFGLQPSLPADAANYPTLTIPGIGLTTPVAPLELTDHQLEAPATIAGAYSNQPNKTLIIGHSSTVFKNLQKLNTSQEFSYNDDSYRITDIKTLAKNDISMSKILAASDEETIVIMTCAGETLPNQDATHRLIITAVKL